MYFADGGAEQSEALNSSKEPWLPLTKHILMDNPHRESHSISSVWAATRRRDAYREEYSDIWTKTATSTGESGEPEGMVDVILCPVVPSSAPKIGTSRWWGYTSQWNLLDYPALVFPVDKVDVEKDSEKVEYTPRNDKDKYNWELWEKYGAEGYVNAPVSLQLVARRYVLLRFLASVLSNTVLMMEQIRGREGLPGDENHKGGGWTSICRIYLKDFPLTYRLLTTYGDLQKLSG